MDPKTSKALDYPELSERVCSCCQPVLEANLALASSLSAEEFKDQLGKITEIAESSLFCVRSIISKNKPTPFDLALLDVELNNSCAHLPPQFREDIRHSLGGIE